MLKICVGRAWRPGCPVVESPGAARRPVARHSAEFQVGRGLANPRRATARLIRRPNAFPGRSARLSDAIRLGQPHGREASRPVRALKFAQQTCHMDAFTPKMPESTRAAAKAFISKLPARSRGGRFIPVQHPGFRLDRRPGRRPDSAAPSDLKFRTSVGFLLFSPERFPNIPPIPSCGCPLYAQCGKK